MTKPAVAGAESVSGGARDDPVECIEHGADHGIVLAVPLAYERRAEQLDLALPIEETDRGFDRVESGYSERLDFKELQDPLRTEVGVHGIEARGGAGVEASSFRRGSLGAAFESRAAEVERHDDFDGSAVRVDGKGFAQQTRGEADRGRHRGRRRGFHVDSTWAMLTIL